MNRDIAYLGHIIDAIDAIESFTDSITFQDSSKSDLLSSAVVRKLEVIGEASNKLSNDLTTLHSNVEWAGATGMRNVLIHEYFHVDLEEVWNTIQIDLPKFKKQIKKILAKVKRST